MGWTITYYHKPDGTLVDADSVKLSSAAGTYGVWNTSDHTMIVPDGTDMTKTATGTYTYVLSYGDADDTDIVQYATEYSVAIEAVYGLLTNRSVYDYTTRATPSVGDIPRGTVAWACDEVEKLTGVTTAVDALRHVQAGADRVIAGQYPDDPSLIHTWSWLPTYREITLTATDEDTCTGEFTGTSLALETDAAFFAGTAAADQGRYVYIEDIGLYRITTYGTTTTATLTAATGQHVSNFTAKSCWFAPIMDLPSDFGGTLGEIMHIYSDTYDDPRLRTVTPDEMMRLWRDDSEGNDGVFCYCIVPKPGTSASAQAWQLWWHPRQTYSRILQYRCHIEGGALTDSAVVYLPGGAKFIDLFLQSALAHAELYQFRQTGFHEGQFAKKMLECIAVDKSLYGNERIESMAAGDTGMYMIG